jgi:predicted negative regulator of RcsB-dependent stress response
MNIHINDKFYHYLPIILEIEKADHDRIRSILVELSSEGAEDRLKAWQSEVEKSFDPLKALTVALSLALKGQENYSAVLRLIQQKKGMLYAAEIVHCLFYCEKNRFDEAILILKSLPLAISRLPVISKLRGDILFDLEDYSEALRAYKEALGKVPNEDLVHSRIGEIFLRHKDTASAKTHFLKAVEIDARNMMAHLYLGDIYATEGKKTEAKQEYGICAAIDFKSSVSKLAQQKLLILCREDRPEHT